MGVASNQFPSMWSVMVNAGGRPDVYDDRLTRGGPIVRMPGVRELGAGMYSDSRRLMRANGSVSFADRGTDGSETVVAGTVTMDPSPSLQVSLGPSLDVLHDEAQYVRTVADPLATETFANRYVFATLRQRTLSFDARADWTFTPALSFQLFSQPFASSARFAEYKELRAAGSFLFDVYGRDVGTVTKLEAGRVEIDPDGTGPAQSFVLDPGSNEASFLSRALRVNAVLRWEYRSGSTLYLVWEQTRDQSQGIGEGQAPLWNGLLQVPARNVLLVKATYRLGR